MFQSLRSNFRFNVDKCSLLLSGKHVFLVVYMLLIYKCEKVLTEGISMSNKGGWREGDKWETKPVKSSLLV